MFGSPPRFQTSSEARAVQLMPPVVNNCRLAKQRDHACFDFQCIAYIHLVVLMHVLVYVPPRVCSTAPQTPITQRRELAGDPGRQIAPSLNAEPRKEATARIMPLDRAHVPPKE